ncbi:hypothetical protein BURKHO8Y_40066 [Burkholderia sp. 8Y]|nr:hypothetical protein BURKHO8Y_40066 [Burkholderia sp. 8Y]
MQALCEDRRESIHGRRRDLVLSARGRRVVCIPAAAASRDDAHRLVAGRPGRPRVLVTNETWLSG